MKKFFYVAVALTVLRPVIACAQHNALHIEKEPVWITINNYDYSKTLLDKEAENGYADLTFEKQISLQQQSIYTRKAVRILSEAGVQNRSEINISFDPSYNQLIFHRIQIIRDSKPINKLNLSKIKLVHQETELKKFLYNGTLTAVLFLEDVRKGDIIEYSYTIKGFNPVFKNKYTDILGTNYAVPIYNLYYKLVVPAGRTINIKNNLIDKAAAITQINNATAYEWKFTDVPPLHVQDNIPSWYDPYSMIMISEFSSWKEVNDWAAQLFPFNVKLSPELQKKIETIRATYNDPEQQLLAALHFVQDDVRYMGIEMGVNSHKPNSPDKIFAQRFGDCKDKSYLLCTMLRALGIEASPVLINTEYKKSIGKWLPSATAFDHATVRAKLNNKYHWFDATIPYQRGRLDSIAYPDYQCGLVISDTTTALTVIPPLEKGMVNVKEEFSIPDMTGYARLAIRTVYSGSFADETRSDFHTNSIFETQKHYQEFYANYYDKIKSDSLTYSDNEETGEFTTREYYTISNLWESEKDGKKGYFSPFVINSVLKKPDDADRTMPFTIQHPARYREEVLVNLPKEWSAEESVENINCTAFKLHTDFSYSYKKLRLLYEYETLKDYVNPDEAGQFFASFKKADKDIHYELTSDENGPVAMLQRNESSSNTNKNTGFLVFIVLALLSAIVWYSQRK